MFACSVTNDENGKAGKNWKEYPAGCAGESEQRKGNIGEEKRTVASTTFSFCDEMTRAMW